MSQSKAMRRDVFAIHLVVFLAGLTFLIYEVSWNRLLSLVLGTTVTASTLVLAAFMAGFGGGAMFWGRFADRRPQIGRLLAALLLGVGATSGLGFLVFEQGMPALYASLAGAGTAVWLTELLMFILASVLLLIPSFLMGGVFPLASKVAARAAASLGSALGRLYAVETLGSTLGGLAAGFLLLGWLGQRGTVGVAIAIDLLLGGWLLIARRFGPPDDTAASATAERTAAKSGSRQPHSAADPTSWRTIALVGAFICGFAILSLQVIWLRMLKIYLTNTSYTFALVSSLAILGLSIGSAFYRRRSHLITDAPRTMLRVLLGLIVVTLLGLWLLANLPQVLMFPFQNALVTPWARVLVLPLAAALLVVLPPALFSGFAFPLACRMYAGDGTNVSRDVGLVLMVNTLGSVAGPLLAAFLLLPWLGAVVTALLIIALVVGATLFILQRSTRPGAPGPLRFVLIGALLILAVVVVIRPEIRILPPSFVRFDREILHYQEAREGTLTVGKDRGTRTEAKYTFVNNSAVIGSSYDAIKVVKMVGHFPFLLGLECRDVLVIGFGIGVTTSAIASHAEVESIECVELVEGLRQASVYYQDLNHNVARDPRLKFISGDGRHYLQMTPRTYDLISCDPTHPILGSGNLYTRDYFELCREHLNPGGMVSQYLPLHKLGTKEFLGLIRTFESVFPHCTVWLGHYHAVLLGSTEPIEVAFPDWAARAADLGTDYHFYTEPHHLAATLALNGPAIARLGDASAINTDDLSYTEFFAPNCLDAGNIAANLKFLLENRVDVQTVFADIPDAAQMARFARGNALLGEGLYYKLRGDERRCLQALQAACTANPEDEEYPLLIRLNY